MEIYPLGHASFKLKGKAATVVTDPFDPGVVGLKFPKTTAHIVTVSHDHPDHNFVSLVFGEDGPPVVFSGPGEYEARGVEIVGIATFHDGKNGSERGKNTVYKIEMDGISLVHLGDLGHKLIEEQVDVLNGVDVLFVPVGGIYTIDAHLAAEIVTELEPAVAIPMHYGRSGLNPKIFTNLSPLSAFLKEMGKEGITPQPKLKVTKDLLPPEMQVVVLE